MWLDITVNIMESHSNFMVICPTTSMAYKLWELTRNNSLVVIYRQFYNYQSYLMTRQKQWYTEGYIQKALKPDREVIR